MRPQLEEEHAVAGAQHAIGALLRHDHRRSCRAGKLDRLLGALRVELRGRLVEQQQLWLQRQHRREADALELAAGELGHAPLGEMRGTNGGEPLGHPRADVRRRRADVLQPERDLGGHAREHDLVLRVLEERRDGSRQVSRPRAPRVVAAHLDPAGEAAAVEVRHEAGQRPQQRGLATTGGTEQRYDLSRLELERDVVQRRVLGLRVGERQLLDPR